MDVEQILETLSYLEKFKENIVVIKFSGEFSPKEQTTTLFKDISLLKKIGMHPVVVHGGGKEITEEMERRKLKPQFICGYRVTDEKSIGVIKSVLTSIRKGIVQEMKKYYSKCIGYPTENVNIFSVEKLVISGEIDLGYVGSVKKVLTQTLYKKIFSGFIPVISSLGRGKDGKTYNINADMAAAELAVAMCSEKLFFLTDVKGVYSDFCDEKSVISEMNSKECERLILSGKVSSGMIPKLQSAISATRRGVKSCYIISGKIPHALLIELFTEKGLGTMIKK